MGGIMFQKWEQGDKMTDEAMDILDAVRRLFKITPDGDDVDKIAIDRETMKIYIRNTLYWTEKARDILESVIWDLKDALRVLEKCEV